MNVTELDNLPFTISDLHRAYRTGVSVKSMVSEAFKRIAAADDAGIFLCLLNEKEVLAEAATLGPFDPVSYPLWGIPFAIKDNIDARDLPTTAGCPDYAFVAQEDAFAVKLLREAGALLVGKTNLDQL